MTRERHVMEDLLSGCGVTVNGSNPWDIKVNDERLYARVLRGKNQGLGESYMDGWWDCPRIDELMCRVLSAGLDERVHGGLKLLVPYVRALLFNRQNKSRSQEVAERHYDLGNDLFLSFLDPYNQYS